MFLATWRPKSRRDGFCKTRVAHAPPASYWLTQPTHEGWCKRERRGQGKSVRPPRRAHALALKGQQSLLTSFGFHRPNAAKLGAGADGTIYHRAHKRGEAEQHVDELQSIAGFVARLRPACDDLDSSGSTTGTIHAGRPDVSSPSHAKRSVAGWHQRKTNSVTGLCASATASRFQTSFSGIRRCSQSDTCPQIRQC